jgi:hypothetical protein
VAALKVVKNAGHNTIGLNGDYVSLLSGAMGGR